MPTETRSFEYRVTDAYRVETAWFTRFANQLRSLDFERLSISADLGRNRHLTDLTMADLLALPNSKSEQVTNIVIAASTYAPTALSVSVHFYLASCELRVNGAERDAIYAFEKLKTSMDDIKVSYEWLRRGSFWLNLGCSTTIISFASGALLAALYILKLTGAKLPKNLWNVTFVIAVVFWFAMFLVAALEWAAKRLFPASEIMIGDGIVRSAALAETRRNILWVVIAGVAVTAIAAVVTRLLKLS